MKLVIVESPNKCHTISKYLGKDYIVLASNGHIRDLSTSGKGGFGVDVQNGFTPSYIVCKNKYQIINELKEAAKKVDEVLLATDPDREGEAIAWHLAEILNLDIKKTKRLEFHEITRASIEEAIKHPRTIDMNLVNSQETRRIIDRIIGFKLSNILQRKIKSRSAGRVQSAALKLICDHNGEIANFVPEEYWNLSLDLNKDNKKIKVNFASFGNIKKITSKEQNDDILAKMNGHVVVSDIKKTYKTTESKPAFTTSTLQQEAFNVYHFSTKKTANIAQALYEGIQLGDEHVGLITYIRTDSTYLSDTYVDRAKAFIIEKYGSEYVGQRKTVAVTGAQNAHEAIRPTSNHRVPWMIKQYLTPDQYKLYKLIYERALGSLMAGKKEAITTYVFDSNGVSFKTDDVKVTFDGYTKLGYQEEKTEDQFPSLSIGEELKIVNVNNEQKFTEPPTPYSEAKIVKLMEEKGIGRPSTYASTITTLISRKYIESKAGIVTTTEQGTLTSTVLNKYFPTMVDIKYTANMEKDLDKIQEGSETRQSILNEFYEPFMQLAEKGSKEMYPEVEIKVGRVCPKCGSPLVMKKGRFGDFIGCSNFPKCNYREKGEVELEFTGENCPKCGKPLVYRKGNKNKKFIACSGYPSCDYIKPVEKTVVVVKKCPKCGGDLVERYAKGKKFLGCSNYPKCKYIENIKQTTKE